MRSTNHTLYRAELNFPKAKLSKANRERYDVPTTLDSKARVQHDQKQMPIVITTFSGWVTESNGTNATPTHEDDDDDVNLDRCGTSVCQGGDTR